MLNTNHAVWRCGNHEISLARPRIMGALNVTPDSFSDGGENLGSEAAVARGLAMLDEGADIIDVGGESTRPGHRPVSPEEEIRRIAPVVRGLVAGGAVVSIDTRHAEVARMGASLGAAIINDVTGFTDPAMVKVAAETDCGCLAMHWDQGGLGSHPAHPGAGRKEVQLDDSRPARPAPVALAVRGGVSQHRFTLPDQAPIMRQIMGFLGDQARVLQRAGVSHDRICLDPGPGFDKFADEDVVIQRATRSMVSMGYPLCTAVSRKRFVGAVAGVDEAALRDAATQGMCIAAVANGSRVLRVHDVAGCAQAVNAYWAVAEKDARQGFVSLGSNVGERVANLTRAVQLIDQIPLTCVANVSHAYETEPAYGISTPVVNCVAEIRTELHPLVLMDHLLKVEDKLGRKRDPNRDPKKPGHTARTIDCDLIWVEGETHQGAKLTLPHPRLGERDYVIVPMEDLMHNPARFLEHGGVRVAERTERVGAVTADLGEIEWA
ncbi:2-amino-4-hydroxy-6-hydroxymethyldihydropteridine diphosphokinase [Paratractidigestivibacter sp.]|uniref:2-amino-4-hydroxy-6- hydroxymethyldihydropteridine diphosphokinase n=1 Tax=Paratractidigestivibacter sp. TaxID=2847316 RepID=UPI002ABE0B09|nr:2-amino-4-hydroxy-6-hydroxymethyldihydropteridine diphosphokinase [Paratractidigestivibacter sp.]